MLQLAIGNMRGDAEVHHCGLEATHFYEIGLRALSFELFSIAIEFWSKALEMSKGDSNVNKELIVKIESTLSQTIQNVSHIDFEFYGN